MGRLPQELLTDLRPMLDLLQFYGLQQRTNVAVASAALAEGAVIQIAPSRTQWFILFDATLTITKTATMTALTGQVAMRYNADLNQEVGLKSEQLGPFGATETGQVSVIWTAPYPRICPPNTEILGRCPIIGTDANAAVVIGANCGILG